MQEQEVMKRQELRNIIEEAYYELLAEQGMISTPEQAMYERACKMSEAQLKTLLNELDTQEFLDAVEDEFDLETLKLMKGVIEKRLLFLNKAVDLANPRTVVKGYIKEAEGDEEETAEEETPDTEFPDTGDLEGAEEEAPDATADILAKFPTLKKTIVHLMTPEFSEFVEKVGWMSPKPSTFKIELKNGQDFMLKWMGQGFEATVEGKRYYLQNLSEYQQCLDKLTDMLASGPIQSGMGAESGEDIFGGVEGGGGEFPGAEGGAAPEAGAEAGAEAPAAGGEEDVFAGVEA